MNLTPPTRKKRQGNPRADMSTRNVKAEIKNLRVLMDMLLQDIEKGTNSANVIPALEAYGKSTLQLVELLKADRVMQESKARENLNAALSSMAGDSQPGETS